MRRYYDNWEENEHWVDLRDYPNHQISTYGRIRNKRNGYILKNILDKDGYCVLSIGNVDNVSVHRLMCKTFYGEPEPEQTQVNHLDCDRSYNHILNLTWSTPKENVEWAYRYGNLDPFIGLSKAVEVNKKPVRIKETGQVFASVKDCAEYLGVAATNISRVLKGERFGQKIHGYHIEYVREEEM